MASQNYRNTVQEWDEKLIQCPYFPSHQIRPARFGHHLIQCRKALSKQPTSPYYHKIDDLVVCKFNSHHHIPREKMDEHIKKCQGVVTVLKAPHVRGPELFNSADDGISNIMTGIARINQAADEEDDWDDDVRPAYDPTAKAAALPMHLPAGLTPAERRNYRIAKRHNEHIDVNDPEDDWSEPPGASYPPPAESSSWTAPTPPPGASYPPPTSTAPIPSNAIEEDSFKSKKKSKNKKKVDVEISADGFQSVPKKGGGGNPGNTQNGGRGGGGQQGGGGGPRQPPPGFGNKFSGLAATNEGQKSGGRNNRGGNLF